MKLTPQWNRTNKSFREISASNGFPLPLFGHIFNILSFVEKTKLQAPIAAIGVQEIVRGPMQQVYEGGGVQTYVSKAGGMLSLTNDYMIFINAFDNQFRALARKDLFVVKQDDTPPTFGLSRPRYGFRLSSEITNLNFENQGSAWLIDSGEGFQSQVLEKFLTFSGHYTPKPPIRMPQTQKLPAPPLPKL